MKQLEHRLQQLHKYLFRSDIAASMSRITSTFIIVLFFTSCGGDPGDEFSRKEIVGVCQENQGMVTWEANLYMDSTFYQPGNPLVGYSYGKFGLSEQGITFITLGGEQNFCSSYKYDPKSDHYYPMEDCPSDPLNIYWHKPLLQE